MIGAPRWQRAYVVATCAIIGGAFAYAACDWGHWPRLTYHPLSGTFTMRTTAAISMPYLGTVAWGLGGAICGALLGAIGVRLVPRVWAPRTLQLLGAWSITAILLAGWYYTWNLWPW
jgi:hypothetical protein